MVLKVVYKIFCDDNENEFYVGSTINYNNRKSSHKHMCNNGLQTKLYNYMRENGGFINFTFSILEIYNGDDIIELREREKYYIKTLHPTLNINIPNRKANERYNDNIDDIKAYRQHRTLCECGKYYDNAHKARHLLSNYHLKHC